MANKKNEVKEGEGEVKQEEEKVEEKEAKEVQVEKKARPERKSVDLTSLMYKLILERGNEGVLQSEVWKELGLTSRDGSRIAIRLERRGMIKRERVLEHGRWTYRLIPLRFPVKFGAIEGVPCITCRYEYQCREDGVVNPVNCPPELEGKGLANWAVRDHEEFKRKQEEEKMKEVEERVAIQKSNS
jgi:DNA-binding Lrp family transcriptional regulator